MSWDNSVSKVTLYRLYDQYSIPCRYSTIASVWTVYSVQIFL